MDSSGGDTKLLDDEKNELALLQSRVATMQSHPGGCRMVSTVTSTDIPFIPLMVDANHLLAWGLDVHFNDKSARLQIDTGAGGLYVSRAIAERAGLQPIATSKISGIR